MKQPNKHKQLMFDTLIGHTYTRKCNSWVYITKINSIFCVKTCVINQINATANDISCCESWTIRFSCSGWAEGVPIISMVTIWILFPTYQPGTKNQVNFLHFQKHYGTTSWLRKKKKHHDEKILFLYQSFYYLPGNLFMLTPCADNPIPI